MTCTDNTCPKEKQSECAIRQGLVNGKTKIIKGFKENKCNFFIKIKKVVK